MATSSERTADGGNADFPWDEFDSTAYLEHNYLDVREDDRQILELVGDFFDGFTGTLRQDEQGIAHGIDVGTGPNLYPALTMLPFCEDITLYEYSASNIDWLRAQRNARWPSWGTAWGKFWDLLCARECYRAVPMPQKELEARTTIVQGSVFGLPSKNRRWEMGTMFFVAESITPQSKEFRSAVDCFLDVLAPKAPFAIAFMENSAGYLVGDRHFPATSIGKDDVRERLRDRVADANLELHHIGTGENPLRDGYSGMIVALGTVDG